MQGHRCNFRFSSNHIEETSDINLNKMFYLAQYVQIIIISTYIWYKHC